MYSGNSQISIRFRGKSMMHTNQSKVNKYLLIAIIHSDVTVNFILEYKGKLRKPYCGQLFVFQLYFFFSKSLYQEIRYIGGSLHMDSTVLAVQLCSNRVTFVSCTRQTNNHGFV